MASACEAQDQNKENQLQPGLISKPPPKSLLSVPTAQPDEATVVEDEETVIEDTQDEVTLVEEEDEEEGDAIQTAALLSDHTRVDQGGRKGHTDVSGFD